MASVSPLTVAPTSGTNTSTNSASTLGKDDFLRLLIGQLRSQNPLNPSTDQDYIAQMAQFSMVEQVSNMALANERMLKTLRTDQAFGLLGKTVTYTKADGTEAEGVVQQVTIEDNVPTLTVGDVPGIDPAAVTEVR